MEDRIRAALDEVRAPGELKRETVAFLESRRKSRGPVRLPRRGMAAALAVCAVAFAFFGGMRIWAAPVAYISVDVNPSLELSLNRWDRVVETRAFSEDYQPAASLSGRDYRQAIALLLEEEPFQSALERESLLSFTVLSDAPEALLASLAEATDAGGVEVVLYSADDQLWQEAHSHHMSAGRYRAVLDALEADPQLTLEDCRNHSMRELHEHAGGNGFASGGSGCTSGGRRQQESGRGHHGRGHS